MTKPKVKIHNKPDGEDCILWSEYYEAVTGIPYSEDSPSAEEFQKIINDEINREIVREIYNND